MNRKDSALSRFSPLAWMRRVCGLDRSGTAQRSRRTSALLHLEALEERTVLSHFRYSTLSWSPDPSDATNHTIDFHMQQSWRSDFGWLNPAGTTASIVPGSIIVLNISGTSYVPFDFGDGQTNTSVLLRITSVDTANDLFVGEVVHQIAGGSYVEGLVHNYTTAKDYTNVGFLGFARLSTLQDDHDEYYSAYTTVNVGTGNASPVSALAPIVQVPDNAIDTFQIPASDPNGDPLTYRLSTPAEAAGGNPWTSPPSLSVSSSGLVTWDIRNSNAAITTVPGDLWTTQIIIEDHVGTTTGAIKSKTSVDFILQVTAPNTLPTVTASPTGPFFPVSGQNLSFTVTANDADAGDTIANLVALNAPAGMTFSTFTPGKPASITASWTPTAAQATGTYVITFQATDSRGGNGQGSVTITPQAATPTFDSLAGPSIVYGTGSATLSGHVTSGSGQIPPGNIGITVNGVTQQATINASTGNFSSVFTTSLLNAGAYPITYSYAGSTNFKAASDTSKSLTVTKATPSITWATPASITYGTALSGIQLNATTAIGGTFAYTPASGTVLNAGLNQALSTTFTPADTVDYTTATGSVSINVNKASQTINWANPADIVFGTPLGATQLNATVSVAGPDATTGALTYNPVSGTLLSAGAGQTLSVTAAATSNYNSATGSVTINVGKATPVVTWANPANITYGTPLSGPQLNATTTVAGTFAYTPASGTVLNAGFGQVLSTTFTPTDTVDYNSASGSATINVNKASQTINWSNPANIVFGTALSATQLNATVSVGGPDMTTGALTYTPASGTVLGAGAGQSLQVTAAATSNYNSATKSVVINVGKATPVITWANPADITYGTPLSGTQLNASTTVAGSFTYSPGSGTVLNAGLGQVLSVSFTPTDTTDYNNASGSATSNVNKAAQTINWSNPADIVFGTPLSATQLNATVSVPGPDTTKGALTYNPVSGTVLSAGAGQTLSVTAAATTNYNSATKSVTINVGKATPVITWVNPADITYGTALSGTQLNATTTVAGTFAYTPVSGTVLNAGLGQLLSVTFTPTDTADYNTASGSATINVNKANQTITWANPANIVFGTPLSATQLNATVSVSGPDNTTGALTYSPSSGIVLGAGSGQSLSVTAAATANYNSAAKSVVINVGKATPVVTWANPADITYGTPLSGTQLNASTTVAGTFAYTPASGTVLNAGLGQVLSTTFTPTDTADYNTASGSATINVNKASQTISWNNPADILFGTPLSATQLNATVSVPGPDATTGALTYTPASGTVLGAGAGQSLSVTAATTANYNSATKSVTINVGKATPVITWANPANIAYGTPLTGTQLNATTTVAGTFAYTPASGTVLNAGLGQTLSATFTPSDTTTYNSANAQVLLNVNKASLTITAAANTKVYDGTTSAGATPTVSSLVGTDSVTGLTETYDTQHAGTGKTLSVAAGYVVHDGNGGNNYTVAVVPNTAGVISRRAITVTAATNTKPYDGTISAAALPTITGGSLAGSDSASFSETYDTPLTGTGKTLTAAGSVSDGIGGADYTVSFVANTTGVINQPPTITSVPSTAFVVGGTGTFNVTATGFPTPTFTETGALPSGVTLSSAGVLTGMPATVGSYPIVITASNGVSPNAIQNFTLTVSQPPQITSANSTTFFTNGANSPNTFQVTATGTPTPVITETGTLPDGVTFNSSTGVLSGTPTTASLASSPYHIVFTATAGGIAVTQNFTLIVSSLVIDDGTMQRSMVRSVTYTLPGIVTPNLADFSLLRMNNGVYNQNMGIAIKSVTTSGGNTLVTLRFTDAIDAGTSLVDGDYQLSYQSSVIATFHRLFGDINGDRKVDAVDKAAFDLAMGPLLQGSRKGISPNYNQYFDYFSINQVNATDLSPFNARYLHKLDQLGNVVPL